MTEFTNVHLDRLAELVPQDKADQAIVLAARVRDTAIASASLYVAEYLEAKSARIEELETALDEAEAALVRRGHEINLLNDAIDTLKTDLAVAQETGKFHLAELEKATASLAEVSAPKLVAKK